MRVLAAGLIALVASGCNCQPDMSVPDASVPLTLAWPDGARIEITATTASSADLKWPEAIGPVATYRVSWLGGSKDESSNATNFTGLTLGQHLPVEVIAVASDGTSTPPLRAEVAPAAKLEVPDGDISTDFCGANAFLRMGSAGIPCDVFSVLTGHVWKRPSLTAGNRSSRSRGLARGWRRPAPSPGAWVDQASTAPYERQESSSRSAAAQMNHAFDALTGLQRSRETRSIRRAFRRSLPNAGQHATSVCAKGVVG